MAGQLSEAGHAYNKGGDFAAARAAFLEAAARRGARPASAISAANMAPSWATRAAPRPSTRRCCSPTGRAVRGAARRDQAHSSRPPRRRARRSWRTGGVAAAHCAAARRATAAARRATDAADCCRPLARFDGGPPLPELRQAGPPPRAAADAAPSPRPPPRPHRGGSSADADAGDAHGRRELQLLAEQLERRAALLAEREAMQGNVEAGALSRAKAEALRQLGAAQQVVSRRALAAKRLALLGQCWRALVLHKMASQLLTDRRHFRQLLQQPAGAAGTAAGAVDEPVTPVSLRPRRSSPHWRPG